MPVNFLIKTNPPRLRGQMIGSQWLQMTSRIICLTILIGVHSMLSIPDYWSQYLLHRNPVYSAVMSRNRYVKVSFITFLKHYFLCFMLMCSCFLNFYSVKLKLVLLAFLDTSWYQSSCTLLKTVNTTRTTPIETGCTKFAHSLIISSLNFKNLILLHKMWVLTSSCTFIKEICSSANTFQARGPGLESNFSAYATTPDTYSTLRFM